MEKALQTPTREQVQQEADRATFERRALAVERERAIGENELQTQIELARREEQLVAQRGANARRQAEEAAAADRIETEARPAATERLAEAQADGDRAVGEAEAAAEAGPAGRLPRPARGHAARAGAEGAGRQPAADRQPGAHPGPARAGAGPPRGVRRHDASPRGSCWCTGAPSSTSCWPGTAPAGRRRSSCAPAAATSTRSRPGTSRSGRRWPRSPRRSRPTGGAAWSSGPTCPGSCSSPDDVVVVVGQDGLVANVAKYLDGQPVIGVNPEPARNPGVLVPHTPDGAGALIRTAAHSSADVEQRTMVEAVTDDGQRLLALNEIYVGHPATRPPATCWPCRTAGGAAGVVRRARRHRHRRDRLVPLGLAGAQQQARAAGARRTAAGLVRPRGLAVARDRHVPGGGVKVVA